MFEELLWTTSQLRNACRQKKAEASAHECVIKFTLLPSGVQSGYLVKGSGDIKRFPTNTRGWSYIDRHIKRQ
jgi:hypothetical protein